MKIEVLRNSKFTKGRDCTYDAKEVYENEQFYFSLRKRYVGGGKYKIVGCIMIGDPIDYQLVDIYVGDDVFLRGDLNE